MFDDIVEYARRSAKIGASAAVREEQRRTLLVRSKVLCVVAMAIYPFTILSYVAAFHPDALSTGALIAALATSAALLLLLALRRGLFDSAPGAALFVLLGIISNGAELATLNITGGPTESNFFFPYYLIFFGIATFFPGRLATVLFTCLALPLGYLGLGHYVEASSERHWSNVILLVDYAALAVCSNIVVTTIFLREVSARLELQNANERLLELDRAKTEFFANLSHELRTPLTLMLTPAWSLLDGDDLTPEQRRLVIGMRRNAARLLGLINDLLLLAKLEAGANKARRQPVEVAAMLRRTIEAMAPHATGLGLDLRLDVPKGEHVWNGDASHLDRIVMNLVSNACKFSEPGGVIDVKLTPAPDDALVLSVSDTGVGIAREHVATLFDRFVQVDSGANRRFEGTGIGLALVKELAELHAGRVEVESEPGKGSTFRVHLPHRDAEGEHEPHTEPAEPRLSLDEIVDEGTDPTAEPRGPDGAPTVMVVEDNDGLLTYLTRELSRTFRVVAVRDSTLALPRANEDPPDIVLSDIMMPVMDGIELARKLREQPATREIPIILMSALEDVETKLEGFDAGVDDYVAKPFQMPELRARLAVHLRLRAQTRELEDALDRLKKSEATLVHNERMAILGTVVAGVAHEINNPIHFMQGNIKLLRKRLQPGSSEASGNGVREMLDDIQESAERLEFVARELLRYGRKEAAPNDTMNLREVVDLAIRIVSARADGARLESVLAEDEVAYGNSQSLFQISLNLLQNALQAKAEHVRIDSARRNGMVELRFQDDGCGISKEDLERVMEPFFTTKPPGEGTGLGLSIVQQLVAAQGGKLAIDSAVGKGTTVSLTLPISRRET